jgi:hypothetical protein
MVSTAMASATDHSREFGDHLLSRWTFRESSLPSGGLGEKQSQARRIPPAIITAVGLALPDFLVKGKIRNAEPSTARA